MRRLIIGVGNEMRGDDGAGLLVARLLQDRPPHDVSVLQHNGEGSALIEAWQDYEKVILVDAAAPNPLGGNATTGGGAAPGVIQRLSLDDGPLPVTLASSLSSHAFGVTGAIELARNLQRLPPQLTIYAIEGQDFAMGHPMTPSVVAAALVLAHHLQELFSQSPVA